jgi:hypothetical protein
MSTIEFSDFTAVISAARAVEAFAGALHRGEAIAAKDLTTAVADLVVSLHAWSLAIGNGAPIYAEADDFAGALLTLIRAEA